MKRYKVIEDGIKYDVVKWDSDGEKWWYLKNSRHRIKGPAIECANGDKAWFLNGIEYDRKDYYRELLKRNLISKKEAFIELI